MVIEKIKLIECPRDAMQGWKSIIPTAKKIEYINALLKVGFHTLDCGSFVSSKAIPQMADTPLIIPRLDLENTNIYNMSQVNETGTTNNSLKQVINDLSEGYKLAFEQSRFTADQKDKEILADKSFFMVYNVSQGATVDGDRFSENITSFTIFPKSRKVIN